MGTARGCAMKVDIQLADWERFDLGTRFVRGECFECGETFDTEIATQEHQRFHEWVLTLWERGRVN